MIVFVKADGTVQSILPSPVYQGSSLEGSLYFVAPFPETNAVEVAFVRANGDVIGKYGLTRVTSGLPDVLDKLGTEYNVWEWQASNADVTAYAGEVAMQFRVIYAGQTLATASTVFTVQEGVIPQPVEPSADQWDTLIELYSRLNAKVPDAFLTDIAISEPDEDNIVTVTKYYNNGTTATEEFPAGGTSFSVKSEWVKVIDFTTSAWVNASSGSGYEIAFPPSQTGYTDNKFLTSLESTETGGYSTLADTVFKGSDGSVLISATEKYNGRLITLGGGIWGGVNVTAGSGEDSVQQVGGALANGKQSAALGFGTVAGSDYETVVGQYNVSRTDALFQVGNGTNENNRKDAFTVLKDGRAKVQTAPSDSDDVVRKDDLAGKGLNFDADGKLQVKAGANLSFGADGSLNAVGSQGSEYANTSEIVDNAITLTSTSTLADLATQILAQKTKVVSIPYGEGTSRDANITRILGSPSDYATSPYDRIQFKVFSTSGDLSPTSGAYAIIDVVYMGSGEYKVSGQIILLDEYQWIWSGWNAETYPVGSIYLTTANRDPAGLFGGIWEQIKDVFLLAAGDTYTAGSTGGSADAVVVLHDHIEYGTNTGGTEDYRMAYISETGTDYGVYYEPDGATVGSKGVFVRTADAGVDGTGKNMPPYLAVYMWKRIA